MIGYSAWWLSGWQRKWRRLLVYRRPVSDRVWSGLMRAEDRYQKDRGFGKYDLARKEVSGE